MKGIKKMKFINELIKDIVENYDFETQADIVEILLDVLSGYNFTIEGLTAYNNELIYRFEINEVDSIFCNGKLLLI